MTYISKPNLRPPGIKTNRLGLSKRDYEAGLSTLCAGCGHDSTTKAIINACYELDLEPYKVAKMSGIGCSSKTPGYFMKDAHGVNSVHGRMPSVTTGAYLANPDLTYIGVSGDGDTTAIGLSQYLHAIRRNLNMLYIVENNGVYGLTKGQFSASADIGSKTKKGETNFFQPIDPAIMAIQMGAGFVARSFSGDKNQLVPLIKAGLKYKGFALIDVISPCVTFNNHEGSTKSYKFTRDHYEISNHVDFVPTFDEIEVKYSKNDDLSVDLFDGNLLKLSKKLEGVDIQDKMDVLSFLDRKSQEQKVVTGLLYLKNNSTLFSKRLNLPSEPLSKLSLKNLSPTKEDLVKINLESR